MTTVGMVLFPGVTQPDVTPTRVFTDAPALDLLFVPGGPGVSAAIEDVPLLTFVRERGSSARWVPSVCTGALLLGTAGLLRGYCATTHWLSLDLLPRYGAMPAAERVVLDPNCVTGAGVTAGIDLALVLAAALRGEELAREIQLTLEYYPAPPFDSGTPRTADAALVERVRSLRHPAQDARREQALRLGGAP